jgi:hypothetical protein
MKRSFILSSSIAALLFSLPASAQTLSLGPSVDIGVPSGLSIGITVHPFQDWLTVSPSLNWNYLSFGGRLSVKLDPMALAKRLPFGVFLDYQIGFFEQGTIPGHSPTSLSYDYINAYGGLRFGRASSFHWNIELGASYLSAGTQNAQSLFTVSNASIGNPRMTGWITPTFITGFEIPFAIKTL